MAAPKVIGKATAIPATETAANMSMLPKLKIMAARRAYSHSCLRAFIRSSVKLKPSNPRLPTVKAQINAVSASPKPKSI